MQQRSGGGAKHCCAACCRVCHLSHLTAATATAVEAPGTAEAASTLHHTVARHLHTVARTAVAVSVVLLGRQGCATHSAAAAAAVCCSSYWQLCYWLFTLASMLATARAAAAAAVAVAIVAVMTAVAAAVAVYCSSST
eukprot:14950-Heterococcus_DN1.PRE.2